MNTSKLVLFAEDNASDELFIQKELQKKNCPYQIKIARDGQQALYLLNDMLIKINNKALPDLIILDINLPKINGLEVLKLIKERETLKTFPVVMLTSSNEKCNIKNSYLRNANSYIQKPHEFTNFVEVFNQIIDYWLKLNLTPVNSY